MPTAYKIEPAPDRRAGCMEKVCKEQKIKFDRGEIRYGTWVEMSGAGFDSAGWRFKHWGCVTPKQLENLKKFTDGNMDLLEGFDELDPEWQGKVERALEQGHIDDDDWKGEVEFNRPGKHGMRSRKKKVVPKAEESGNESPTTPAPKTSGKKRGRPKKEEVSPDEGDAFQPPPKKKAKAKTEVKYEESNDNSEFEAPTKKKRKQTKPKTKANTKAKVKAEAASEDEKEAIPVKTERRARVKPEPTSDDDVQVVVENQRKSRVKGEPASNEANQSAKLEPKRKVKAENAVDDDAVLGSGVESAPTKKGRGKPKTVAAPKPRGRGRPKKSTAEAVEEEEEAEAAEKMITQDAAEEAPTSKTRGRGRPKKKQVVAAAANAQTTDGEINVEEDTGETEVAGVPKPKLEKRAAGRRGRSGGLAK